MIRGALHAVQPGFHRSAPTGGEMDGTRLAVTLTVDQLRELVRDIVAEALIDLRPDTSGPATLSGAQMAERIGVSRTTMHSLRVEGCPAIRVGDAYRYEPDRVLTWLRSRGPR